MVPFQVKYVILSNNADIGITRKRYPKHFKTFDMPIHIASEWTPILTKPPKKNRMEESTSILWMFPIFILETAAWVEKYLLPALLTPSTVITLKEVTSIIAAPIRKPKR